MGKAAELRTDRNESGVLFYYFGNGTGNVSAALDAAFFPFQAKPHRMAHRLAGTHPGCHPQRVAFSGAVNRRHPAASGIISTGAVGGNSNLCLCPINKIPGWYGNIRHAAVLAGWENYITRRSLMIYRLFYLQGSRPIRAVLHLFPMGYLHRRRNPGKNLA